MVVVTQWVTHSDSVLLFYNSSDEDSFGKESSIYFVKGKRKHPIKIRFVLVARGKEISAVSVYGPASMNTNESHHRAASLAHRQRRF